VFERFTDHARETVVRAQELARARRDEAIGSEHLLLALVHAEDSVAARVLGALGVDAADVEATLRPVPADVDPAAGFMPFRTDAKLAIEQSLRRAVELDDDHIGSEHLLLGLLSDDDDAACQILTARGVTRATVLGGLEVARAPGTEERTSEGARRRRRPGVSDSRRAAVGLVTCSFCGGAVPEVGRVVRGRAGGTICERCVRDATDILEAAAPEAQDPDLGIESSD